MTISNYVMIPDGSTKVFNKIVADENFTIEGYYLVLLDDSLFCDIGNFYNKKDGLYYEDAAFTTVAGLPEPNPPDPEPEDEA